MTNTDAQQKNSGAGEIRAAHRFEEAALADWLTSHVEGYAGPLTVEQFNGGQSNPTYRLVTPGRSYVMRRKPPGPIAAGAHDVAREARVLSALGTVGFPVPRIFGLCQDDAVIGTAFYVMEMIDGRIFWDATLPLLARDERRACYEAMNDAIAQLHGVDFAAIGLGDYGKHGNYVARQVSRWSRQYLADADTAGRDPNLDRLIDWLPAHMPAGDETAIVHGDFRIDNMVFHPTEPRVIAVLDWELSTLGHPLADFAYHLMSWRMPPTLVPGLKGCDLAALGIPSEAEHVARYCRQTGRDGIADLDFYVTFNMFRFATIIHGIKARMVRGNASSANARELTAALPLFAEVAWAQTGA
jgi:aminoglycoside phosphotransferase (APT) family kinase protein